MSYTKQLKIVFDENNIVVDIKAFKRFEFVIYALYTVFGEFEITSANLYFTQYFKRYFNFCDNKADHVFYLLRKNYHQYYSKKRFEIDLKEYLTVPEKFRYFTLIDGSVVKNSKIQYFIDRNIEYDDTINNFMAPSQKDIKFLDGQGSYERIIRTGQGLEEKYTIKTLEFDIGSRVIPNYS